MFCISSLASADEIVRRTIAGRFYLFGDEPYFAADVDPGDGFGRLFKLEPTSPASQTQLREARHAFDHRVEAIFHKERVMYRNRVVSRAEVISIIEPRTDLMVINDLEEPLSSRMQRLADVDVMILFAEELRPLALADPAIHDRAPVWRRVLRDTHVVTRIERAPGGREALHKLRRLVLADLLFTNFSRLRGAIGSFELEDYLDSAAELWRRGAHGIFKEIEHKMTEHLEVMTWKETRCIKLLEHFNFGDVEVLDLMDRMTMALDQLRWR